MGNYRIDNDRYLFISDLQIPFEASGALSFCKYVRKYFKIPDENIYCVGDETDQYFGSLYKKNPDADLTPNSELARAKDTLKQWYDAFPYCKLAISNHGLRWVRKAVDAEIPTQLLKPYRDVIEAPTNWRWEEKWDIPSQKRPMTMIHGMGYSGQNGHRNAAIDLGVNTIIGHLHSHAGISYVKTEGKDIWGMNVGSLVDSKKFAFQYAKYSRFKSCLTIGAVIDGGRFPVLIPYG